MASIIRAVRMGKSPWNGGIEDVGIVDNVKNRPISERIEGLNSAIRREKRMLRTGESEEASGRG